MTDETTTEQLAEIEGQGESTPVTEYTPPEGWRVLRFGELLQPGDMWVNEDGTEQRSDILHWDASAVSGGRCIRRIKPQPESQPQPVQVREGRWRTRGGEVKDVTAMPTDHVDFSPAYPWWDGHTTWSNNGMYSVHENAMDLVEYLGPIEPDKTQELETKTQELPDKTQELPEYTPPEGWRVLAVGEVLQPSDVWVNHEGKSRPTKRAGERVNDERYIRPIDPQPEPEPDTELQAQVAFLKGREVTLGTRLQQEREVTTRLRGDLELVQKLLGTERRKVAQLEDLASSLRTINVAHEKAFTAAGKENTALRNQLAAVASVAADRQRLLSELDAAQQVPADSPELRQLRADLAEVTLGRDTYRDGYNRVLSDLETARETAKAEAVEAIAEWLEPIRAVDHLNLSNEILQHLPQIMRHLTGLDSPEDVD